jgi:hypothetical protein
MKQKNLIVILIVIIAIAVVLSAAYFLYFSPGKKSIFNTSSSVTGNSPAVKGELTAGQIMEIIKTDKDYNDLTSFIKGFDPEVTSYIKLGPDEYQKIKPDWEKQGFGYRIEIVNKLALTDSTYWAELKNKNDTTKGLLTIIDVKANKSLLLIAALSIKAGVGM